MCKKVENGARCRRAHHTDLHDSKSSFCEANNLVAHTTERLGEKAVVLLAMQAIDVVSPGGLPLKAVLFYDDGATLSLCRHTWARKMGLPGRPVTLYLKKVNESFEQLDTVEYVWHFSDNDGQLWSQTTHILDVFSN